MTGSPPTTPQGHTPQQMFDRALAADGAGDGETAITLFQGVFAMIRDDPASRSAAAHVLTRMVDLLVSRGRLEEVVALAEAAPWWAEHAPGLNTPLAQAHHMLGVRAIGAGDSPAGNHHLRAAVGLDPELPHLRENLRRGELHLANALGDAVERHVEVFETGLAETRRRFAPPEVMEALAEAARAKVARLMASDRTAGEGNASRPITVATVIPQLPEAAHGPCPLPDEGRTGLGPGRATVEAFPLFADFIAAAESGRRFDVLIATNHSFFTAESLDQLSRFRRAQPDCVMIAWFWDNHHLFASTLMLLPQFDFAIPAHEIATNLLKACSPNIPGCVPAAVFQWSAADARHFFHIHGGRSHTTRPRSDRLYGSFYAYQHLDREAFIERCQRELPDNDLYQRPRTLAPGQDRYLALSPEQQFADWMGYKVSLVAAVKTDIPVRLFDALLTGQIPLIPSDLEAFDQLVPVETQRRLPVVRYNRHSIASVRAAHLRALALFDRDGVEGAARRHEYAVAHHMILHRVADLVGKVVLVSGF